MIKRKIWRELANYRNKVSNSALLLTGARQVGKTFIVREFARRHYKCFIEINFIKSPEAKLLFDNLKDEKDFFLRLSSFSDMELVPDDTLVFFDEVQTDDPVSWVRAFLKDESAELTVDIPGNGKINVFANASGLYQKFLFTEI